MKLAYQAVLNCFLVLFFLHSNAQPESFDALSEISFQPYHNGRQLVIFDNTSVYNRALLKYSTMSQPPAWLWNRPLCDEYFIRDTTGAILRSYNSSRDWRSVEQMLQAFPESSSSLLEDDIGIQTPLQKSSFHLVYSCTMQEFNKYDTALVNDLKMGVIDSLGQLIIPIQFQDIRFVKDHFIVKENDLWGMTDLNFNYVVPHDYRDHTQGAEYVYFRDTTWYAMAYNLTDRKMIDLSNMKLSSFDDERGYLAIEKDGKWGLIDIRDTKMLVPAKYDRMVTYHHYSDWRRMNYGEVLVLRDGKYGIESITRGKRLSAIYDRIYQPHESSTGYYKVELDGEIQEIQRR